MQELNVQEIDQVGGALTTYPQYMQQLIDAFKMVNQVHEALIDAVVDVACTATTECR